MYSTLLQKQPRLFSFKWKVIYSVLIYWKGSASPLSEKIVTVLNLRKAAKCRPWSEDATCRKIIPWMAYSIGVLQIRVRGEGIREQGAWKQQLWRNAGWNVDRYIDSKVWMHTSVRLVNHIQQLLCIVWWETAYTETSSNSDVQLKHITQSPHSTILTWAKYQRMCYNKRLQVMVAHSLLSKTNFSRSPEIRGRVRNPHPLPARPAICVHTLLKAALAIWLKYHLLWSSGELGESWEIM